MEKLTRRGFVKVAGVAPETREWKLQDGAVRLPPHSVSIVQGLV